MRIEREREAEVGVQRTFVKLVEQNSRDAVQRGIVEDHPGEYALGDDLDARAGANQALQAHAQPDRLADFLAEARGHSRRGGARGQAARLQHDDLAVRRERFVEQRERNPRRLARAGRRDEHGARPARKTSASAGRASSIGRASGKARMTA